MDHAGTRLGEAVLGLGSVVRASGGQGVDRLRVAVCWSNNPDAGAGGRLADDIEQRLQLARRA
jgi:hypothetical protein